MIIFSDLHLREQSAEVVLGEVLPGLRDACVSAGVASAACLGDFFHLRYRIDARVLNGVLDEFRRWGEAGIYLHMLPGNHDQYEIRGRNALEVFGELDNVMVYTKPTWTGDGLWLPYRKDPADIQTALALKPPPVARRVLFAHIPIRGAYMNDSTQDSDGVPLDWLAPWEMVFCGHYHRRQWMGERCVYVGSAWQTRADESGQGKGYAVWHPSERRVEWLDTAWGPRYHRVTVQAGQGLDLSAVGPRDELRVKVVGPGAEKAAEELHKALTDAGMQGARSTVTPELEHQQARLDVTDGADLSKYVRAYLEQQGGDVDLTLALQMFRDITGVEVAP